MSHIEEISAVVLEQKEYVVEGGVTVWLHDILKIPLPL